MPPTVSTDKKSTDAARRSSTQRITSLFQKGPLKRTWVKANAPQGLAGLVFPVWAEAFQGTPVDERTIIGHLYASDSNTTSIELFLGFARSADARNWIAELPPPFTAAVVLFNPSNDPRWLTDAPIVKPKAVVKVTPKPETSDTHISKLLGEITTRSSRVYQDERDGAIYILCNSLGQANLLRDGMVLWVKTPLQGFEVEVLDSHISPGLTIHVNLLDPKRASGATRKVHNSFRSLNAKMFRGAFRTPDALDSQGRIQTTIQFQALGDALVYLTSWRGLSFTGCPVVSTIKGALPPRKRAAEETAPDPPRKKARVEKGKLSINDEIIDLSSSDEEIQDRTTAPEVIYVSSDDEIEPPSKIKPPHSVLKKAVKIGKALAGSLKKRESTGSRGATPEPEDVAMESSSGSPIRPLGTSKKPNTPTLPTARPAQPTSGEQENQGNRPSAVKKKAAKQETPSEAAKPETPSERVEKESYDPGPIVDLPIPLSSLPPLPRPTPEKAASMRADIPVRIKGWFADRKCQLPESSKVKRTIDLLPDTGEFLLAFDDLKEGRVSSPIAVIQALSNSYNPTQLEIGPNDAAIYIAATSAIKSRLDALADAISGVKGERREEIRSSVEAIAQELKAAGHSDDYVVRLIYAGTTCLLSNRSQFDAYSLAHDGIGKDPRSPHMQAAGLGGGATDRWHTGIVYWKKGAPWIRGYQHEIQPDGAGGDIHFPVITRIAVIGIKSTEPDLRRTLESIVIGYSARRHLNVQLGAYPKRLVDAKLIVSLQAEIDAEADNNLLFLADAPGVHDTPFKESRTGDLYCSLTEALAQRPAEIHIEDFHNQPGHESNLRTVTPAEVIPMRERLKKRPDQRVLVCLGSTVAWVFILRHLCTNPQDKPADNHPFFLPVVTTILGVRCILVLMPHPGVINYIGDLNWVIDAYCNNISMLLIIGTQSARLKSEFTGRELPAKAADIILERCQERALYQDILKELQWPGMRFLWDGPSVMAVGRHRDAGCPWKQICWRLAEEMKPQVIWSFSYPPEDLERNLICIPAANDDNGKGGDVVRSVAVPNLEIPGQFSRDQLHFPKQVRPEMPFFGYVRLDPVSLALQVISLGGEFLRTSGGNIMSISRGHWAVTKGYTPRALQANAERDGFWRPLSVWDRREMDERMDKKDEPGKVTKINLVHTLDAQEIEMAVQRGDSVLHPFQKNYKFHLWDEPTQKFVAVNPKEPWRFPPFDQ